METTFKKTLLAASNLQCMLLMLRKYNLQVQYDRGVEIYMAGFLSIMFTDNKGKKQKQ